MSRSGWVSRIQRCDFRFAQALEPAVGQSGCARAAAGKGDADKYVIGVAVAWFEHLELIAFIGFVSVQRLVGIGGLETARRRHQQAERA